MRRRFDSAAVLLVVTGARFYTGCQDRGVSPSKKVVAMLHPGFFENKGPFAVAELANFVGAELTPGTDGGRTVADVRALSDAGRLLWGRGTSRSPPVSITSRCCINIRPTLTARRASIGGR